MNDAATIHALQQSNLTLHERLKALVRQRDAFRELCVEARVFIRPYVDYTGPMDMRTQEANKLDADLESALAIHR